MNIAMFITAMGQLLRRGLVLKNVKKVHIFHIIIATFTTAMELLLGRELFLLIQMLRTPKFFMKMELLLGMVRKVLVPTIDKEKLLQETFQA
jgi:hypothetical protein